MPERESVYPYLDGREFVALSAALHGVPDRAAAVERALETVDLTDAADRRVGTYSKGMRQRIKMAGALVHDPPVLLLGPVRPARRHPMKAATPMRSKAARP